MNQSNEENLLTLSIQRPDKALFKDCEATFEIARDRRITTPEMAIATGEDLKTIKTLAKQIEEKRTTITSPLNKALREINAMFKPAKGWLAEAERILKSKLLEFQNEQDRIARELQAKVDADALKEREKLERKARLAEVIGREERAEELKEEAETQVVPVIKSAAPKIAGVARRETWKAEVTDKRAFIKHIVEVRPDLMALVQINQSALNAQARELKDDLDWPGVKVLKEASIVARGS